MPHPLSSADDGVFYEAEAEGPGAVGGGPPAAGQSQAGPSNRSGGEQPAADHPAAEQPAAAVPPPPPPAVTLPPVAARRGPPAPAGEAAAAPPIAGPPIASGRDEGPIAGPPLIAPPPPPPSAERWRGVAQAAPGAAAGAPADASKAVSPAKQEAAPRRAVNPALAVGAGRPAGIPAAPAAGAAAAGGAGAGNGPEEEQPELRGSRSLFDVAPSWLISLVIHLLLLLILALFVSPAGDGLGRMLLTIGQSEREAGDQLAEFSIVQESELVEPSDAMPLDTIAEVDVFEQSDLTFESTTPEFAEVDEGLGREISPAAPMVSGRSGALRKTLLALYGGTAETEAAVELGLKWLTRQQRTDGSWSLTGPYDSGAVNENKAAATAMALLAFLGAGHTHQSGEYQEVVDKGIRWLVRQQDRDGFFARDGRSHQQSYAQAQCSIAICELYAMTEDSSLRGPAQLALKYAERAQADKGGWRYRPREPGDTSVTGWYVMALQSGVSAGLEVEPSTLYKVRDFLDSVEHDEGAEYSYQPYGPPTPPMSAEGLLCRQYLGWPRNTPALERGVERLVNEAPFDRNDPNFYYWYYATQTLHHYGGKPWQDWNNVMRVELPAMQSLRGRESGSWAPQRDRWGSSGGRMYSTCFAIYCLEVYYRHMPLYGMGGGEG